MARTSKGIFISRFEDPQDVLTWVEEKIAALVNVPVGYGEDFNVLRYEVGKHYWSHLDYFSEDMYGKRESNRFATVLTYLSEPEEGGETVWLMEGKDGLKRESTINYQACDGGFKYTPRTGDAVLFYSLHTN